MFMQKDKRELPIEGTVLEVADVLNHAEYLEDGERYFTTDKDEANLITSKVLGNDQLHKVVLDVDIPARLIPSSTEGHFHLYIDKQIPWDNYVDLLGALAECGIIEAGYANASVERGYTAARLPWIKKA
jgi:hypothetical protein